MKLLRIFDAETTGLDPRLDRICEVATIDVKFSEAIDDRPLIFERGEMFSTLIDPERPIPPEASGIHDITDEMVAGKPKIADLLDRLKAGPPDAYCAHNSRFDSSFFKPANIPWLDTYRLALWLWPEAPNHKLGTLRYFLNLKLPEGLRQTAHRALWDAYLCAAILRRVAMSGATWEDMLAVSSEPAVLPKLTFGEHAMKPIASIPDSYLQWIIKKGAAFDEDVAHTAMVEMQRRRDEALKAEAAT
jgi:exodeoxyribonuclease X